PNALAFYLVWAPAGTPLSTIVQAIGARWHVEEDLEINKALGLDQYEVRSYLGWSRHITLVLLAAAFLLTLCVHANAPAALPPPPLAAPACPLLIPLTCSEAQHLLARLCFPAPTSAALIWHWSQWRRTHQYWARCFHRRRRATATSPPLAC